MKRTNSIAAYQEAEQYIPGGVNSPVRALRSVGEMPLFVKNAQGTTLTDLDDNSYTDFCLSWGVFIAGHSHPTVNAAAHYAITQGTSYGIPSLVETKLAKLVRSFVPSMERVRFVNSGTEAVMSAVRVARGYTGRSVIVKFDGCYHGHADHLLVSAGSGVVGLSGASSAGVPADFVKYTVSLPFNDIYALQKLFAERGNDIAAVIVEAVPANMGVILPSEGFLRELRTITQKHAALLIFDEVITGFRLAQGGAQQLFGIQPDLTTLGKIVGGGFPAAAFGGRAEIMNVLAPEGSVYQAGTLSGNPVAMSAGIATLEILSEENFYENLNEKTARFVTHLRTALSEKGIFINHIGSMFTLFFSDKNPRNFAEVQQCNTARFAAFFRYMLANGFYISPSQFEANFVSAAHTEADLERFTAVAREFSA
ncbi:MAG: glutamate-1-semialdehyde 2,1-aminomutase [Bacteroidales bacterium]|jgi:glutamate-1-semialdehyde 2,1-aminomutase|nr:glutamate-1-semialdehyde 2,1-aminomutase [Bacteroidales bacterium]